MKGFAMNEGEKKAPWLDTPDPQRFIKNAAKFNDLMMSIDVPSGRYRPSWKFWMMNFQ